MTRVERMVKIYKSYIEASDAVDKAKATLEGIRKVIDKETAKSTDKDATHYGEYFAHYGESKTAATYDIARLFADHPEIDPSQYVKKPAGVTVKFYGIKAYED